MIKFNVFVALAALAFGSSLVFSAPVGFDRQGLASRETYDIEDFVARDFADVDEFHAREYLDNELEAREDELGDVFARSVCPDHEQYLQLISSMFDSLSVDFVAQFQLQVSFVVAAAVAIGELWIRHILIPSIGVASS